MRTPDPVRLGRLFSVLLYWFLLPGLVLAVGRGVDAALGLGWFRPGGALAPAGWGLVAAGVALIGRATRDLRVFGHGTPNPLAPPVRLVVEGSYRLCRHPMFLGYDLAALGVLLLVRSPGALWVGYPALLAGEGWFLSRKEEPSLARRFPSQYPGYQARVPFLVPGWPRRKVSA